MEVLKFPEMRLKKDAVVYQIPIEKIRSNPYQPRRYFQRAALEELSASIREYGILQPLTVRKMSGGSYELVAGERRLRAAELAGLETVPCLLVQVNEYDSAMLALLENIQRQNLSFLEEAEGYRNLMEDYGLTQEELASKLSKSQSFIANKLRILKLEDPLKRLLVENNFTERHARALLKLPDEETNGGAGADDPGGIERPQDGRTSGGYLGENACQSGGGETGTERVCGGHPPGRGGCGL